MLVLFLAAFFSFALFVVCVSMCHSLFSIVLGCHVFVHWSSIFVALHVFMFCLCALFVICLFVFCGQSRRQ